MPFGLRCCALRSRAVRCFAGCAEGRPPVGRRRMTAFAVGRVKERTWKATCEPGRLKCLQRETPYLRSRSTCGWGRLPAWLPPRPCSHAVLLRAPNANYTGRAIPWAHGSVHSSPLRHIPRRSGSPSICSPRDLVGATPVSVVGLSKQVLTLLREQEAAVVRSWALLTLPSRPGRMPFPSRSRPEQDGGLAVCPCVRVCGSHAIEEKGGRIVEMV